MVWAMLTSACGDDPQSSEPLIFELTSPTIPAGGEEQSLCRSWTLSNSEAVYIKDISLTSDRGFHHGNWFYVKETDFPGPDGLWPCAERNFDTVSGTLSGGIFFGQSTQSPSDETHFAEGAAIAIPPNSKIIADVHTLNASDQSITPTMTATMSQTAAANVKHALRILGIAYQDLEIAPHSASEFTTSCDIGSFYQSNTGHAPDFQLYSALPHYHGMGRLARAVLRGGDADGMIVFETEKTSGEPWGRSYEQPIPIAGATALEITCGFENTTDRVVRWGFGDGEMCLLGFMTDSPFRMAGTAIVNEKLGNQGGVHKNRGDCIFLGLL